VVLLRGINLAGHNRVSMPRLREVLSASGYDDVETYVQSGNVVLDSRSTEKAVAAGVHQQMSEALGLNIAVIVRSRPQLAEVAANNPFLRPDVDPGRQLHVAFLGSAPSRAAMAALDPHRAPPDELHARGREVYVWAPNGIGRSKALDGLDRILGTQTSVRNWRTVTSLLEMASARR
jgi:uncharacterized protein (DUF1697 family)